MVIQLKNKKCSDWYVFVCCWQITLCVVRYTNLCSVGRERTLTFFTDIISSGFMPALIEILGGRRRRWRWYVRRVNKQHTYTTKHEDRGDNLISFCMDDGQDFFFNFMHLAISKMLYSQTASSFKNLRNNSSNLRLFLILIYER